MIHTWDWLLLSLPKDDSLKKKVLDNFDSKSCSEIRVNGFILKFDFETEYIYCDCLPEYPFKHKVIPGRIPFAMVKEFLLTNSWDVLDETKMEINIE